MSNGKKVIEEWKRIKIIPVLKPGKEMYETGSYRPISLLLVLMKILNAMIKELMWKHVKQEGLIPKLSMGFKKGEASLTCVNYIVNEISENGRDGQVMVVAFLDLSDAFTSGNVETLAEIMTEDRLPTQLINWTYNNLVNRRMMIDTGEATIEGTTRSGLRHVTTKKKK
jgi:hypothetical protein